MLQNQSPAWPTPQLSQAEGVLISELPSESSCSIKQLTLRVAHLEADLLHLRQRKLDLEKENEEFAASDQIAKVQLAEALAENKRLEALLAEKSSEDRRRCREFEAQKAEIASSISKLQSIFEKFTKMLAENELGAKLWRSATAKQVAASVRSHVDKQGHLDSSSLPWDRAYAAALADAIQNWCGVDTENVMRVPSLTSLQAVRLRLGSESLRSTPICSRATTASRSSPYTPKGRPKNRPKSPSSVRPGVRQRHGAQLQPESVKKEAGMSSNLPVAESSIEKDVRKSADLDVKSEGVRSPVANAKELASTNVHSRRANSVKKMVEDYETQTSLRVQDPTVDPRETRGSCHVSRAVDTREEQSQAATPSCVKHQEFDKVYDALEREAKRDDLLVDRSFRQDLADARRYLRQGHMDKFPCIAEILTDWSNAFDKIKAPTSTEPFDAVRRELEEVRRALTQVRIEGKTTP